MRKLLLFISAAFFLSSCQGVWTQDDKAAFYEACMDDTKTWLKDPEKAKTYCNCVITKLNKSYPNTKDAIENIENLSRDPELQTCKTEMLK